MLLSFFLSWWALAAGRPAPPIDVSSLTASAPALVCELDMRVLKGELRRLSWAADRAYLHVQTLDRTTLRDYIRTFPECAISAAFGEPEWARQYWTMKS